MIKKATYSAEETYLGPNTIQNMLIEDFLFDRVWDPFSLPKKMGGSGRQRRDSGIFFSKDALGGGDFSLRPGGLWTTFRVNIPKIFIQSNFNGFSLIVTWYRCPSFQLCFPFFISKQVSYNFQITNLFSSKL